MIELIQRRSGRVLHRIDGNLDEVSLGRLDLRGADISGFDLHRVDFSGADLSDSIFADSGLSNCTMSGTNLNDAVLPRVCVYDTNLFKALLRWSDLRDSNWWRVSFREADLQCADLRGARFCEADFSEARMDESCLRGAVFINCNFHGANLTKAALGGTVFNRCTNLHEARGIVATGHLGPSSFDLPTLRTGVCSLPDEFLLQAGLSKDEIVSLRTLYKSDRPAQSGACFITYSLKDQQPALLLCQGLRDAGFQAWLCRAQTSPGARSWPWNAKDLLRGNNRLVVLCSAQSLASKSIAEISYAVIEEERRVREQKLFAVRTDAEVLNGPREPTNHDGSDAGPDWVGYIRNNLVADFSRWNNPAAFKSELERLVRSLLHPPRR